MSHFPPKFWRDCLFVFSCFLRWQKGRGILCWDWLTAPKDFKIVVERYMKCAALQRVDRQTQEVTETRERQQVNGFTSGLFFVCVFLLGTDQQKWQKKSQHISVCCPSGFFWRCCRRCTLLDADTSNNLRPGRPKFYSKYFLVTGIHLGFFAVMTSLSQF